MIMARFLKTSVYPEKATCWHDESVVTVGNGLSRIIETSQPYNTYSYQAASANSDEFYQKVILAAGTYAFKRLGALCTAGALVDWYLNSTKIVSSENWSNPGGDAFDELKTTSNVIVSSSGVHTVKAVVVGKGLPMGGGYNLYLTKFWFTKQ